MRRKCIDCGAFEGLNAAGLGQCRRHAPAPVPLEFLPHSLGHDSLRQRWPLVQAHDWCAEWVPGGDGPGGGGAS